MEYFEAALLFIDSLLGSAPWFPFVLLGVGIFFTLYLGFPQIRYFGHAWKVLAGRFDRDGAPGDTSHFQALSTALSGTVGTGNIGGVALALHLGGPAALFWMWATAFLGMTTKFVEVTLSYKYREQDALGHMSGGPMYYMEKGLGMKWLAVFFAIATVISSFGSGNMPQSNNIAVGIESSFGIPSAVTGGVLAVLLGLVIIGGIRRIARVASAIVPFMALAYTVGALGVILWNLENLGPAFVSVFADVFTGSAASGGFLGAAFAYAFNRGVNRGLFSNEAGQGSAPIAHASARGDDPVSEGFVSILEPFIDTILICTLTGMAILASGAWTQKVDNEFQSTDLTIVVGHFDEQRPADVDRLYRHFNRLDPPRDVPPVTPYSGTLLVQNGRVVGRDVTFLHNRSIAEDVHLTVGARPYTGEVDVRDGTLVDTGIGVRGRSLVHSVTLTVEAFKRGAFGSYGEYIVTVGLLLFAFSTAIAWSYYGDRAITYLFGARWVMPYRVIYVAAFFAAAVADTSVVWLVSYVTVALMTLPNLVGIMLLRREMRVEVRNYWSRFASRDD